ncbi:MAG: hypothetical protein U5K76_05310 [Woeseiaceae bacterium]|nr:hypothetical protein [Woeseiaceae bacterium]
MQIDTASDPRTRARILAQGELMASSLAAAWLGAAGLDVGWRDARSLLVSDEQPDQRGARRFLAATCRFEPDPRLAKILSASGTTVTVTQGCVAASPAGETVLLGREGSDTSAAYLAAHLGAQRVEIWTDVPGMFTADPKQVPSARLLVALHYDEARELAATGSRVLHPRCLAPLEAHGIPCSSAASAVRISTVR